MMRELERQMQGRMLKIFMTRKIHIKAHQFVIVMDEMIGPFLGWKIGGN